MSSLGDTSGKMNKMNRKNDTIMDGWSRIAFSADNRIASDTAELDRLKRKEQQLTARINQQRELSDQAHAQMKKLRKENGI